jgi:hypothetical protein
MKKFKSRPGRFTDNDAEIIGNFLLETFPDGDYTAKQVLDVARNEDSPIHQYFEWDDSKAAEQYRLRQARKLITCVVVVDDLNREMPQSVTVAADVSGYGHRTYMNTEKARSIPDIWETVLHEAVQGLLSWKRRYDKFKQLSELKGVINEINLLEQELENGGGS